MQLRHHPLIYSGSAWNWPPVWTQLTKDGKILRGEVGILRKVTPKDPSDDKCYLVIEHEAAHYVSSLIFDDVMFCRLMFSVFKDNIGRSIKEIGDVDLSYTL